MKTGILLINLGTPDSASEKDVKKYLKQFLNDPYVIDINPVLRFFLVNFFIVPFRAPKSAALYKKIWSAFGESPLLFHTQNLAKKLQQSLGKEMPVEFGMRYQSPDIYSAFKKLINSGVEKIIAIPLYPQYASSSTGSSIIKLKKIMDKEKFYNVKIVEHFYRDENFVNAWTEIAKKYFFTTGEGNKGGAIDFFLFSYHGLPERQIFKECKKRGGTCNKISDCEVKMHEKTGSGVGNPVNYCYRASCFETTRQLVKVLRIQEGKYVTSFQSRLNDKWLKPYSDKVVEEKAKDGVKKMLVFSPAFVADCLETIYEIGVEYREIFIKNGGKELVLVDSLNDSDGWVEGLKKIIINSDEISNTIL